MGNNKGKNTTSTATAPWITTIDDTIDEYDRLYDSLTGAPANSSAPIKDNPRISESHPTRGSDGSEDLPDIKSGLDEAFGTLVLTSQKNSNYSCRKHIYDACKDPQAKTKNTPERI